MQESHWFWGGHIFCTGKVDIGRAPPDKPCRQSHFSFHRNTVGAKICFQPVQTGDAAFRKLFTSVPFHRGEGTHRRAAAGIEEEVGGVGCSRWLVGDRPMAKSHAHNRSHVSLRAKDMDGDPSRLPCVHTEELSALGRKRNKMSFCQSEAFSPEEAQQKAGGRNKTQEENIRKWLVLTNFSHDT